MNSPIVDLRRRVQSITWPQALSVARIKPIHLNRASLLIGVVGAAALYFMGIGGPVTNPRLTFWYVNPCHQPWPRPAWWVLC
jgi:hypothetical protein